MTLQEKVQLVPNPENYGFIYVTTNLVNGKKYLGQRRYIGDWKGYLGSGTAIKFAIKKYGKENFSLEIIDEAKEKMELDRLEIEYIKKYNCKNSEDWYNIHHGGKGGQLPGKESHMYGKKLSKEHVENIHNIKPFLLIDIDTGKILKEYKTQMEVKKEKDSDINYYFTVNRDIKNIRVNMNKKVFFLQKDLYYNGVHIDAMKQNDYLYLINIETKEIKIYESKGYIPHTRLSIDKSIEEKRLIDEKFAVIYMKDFTEIDEIIKEYKRGELKYKYRNCIVIIDMETKERSIYKGIVSAASELKTSPSALKYAMDNKTLWRKKYAVRKGKIQ